MDPRVSLSLLNERYEMTLRQEALKSLSIELMQEGQKYGAVEHLAMKMFI